MAGWAQSAQSAGSPEGARRRRTGDLRDLSARFQRGRGRVGGQSPRDWITIVGAKAAFIEPESLGRMANARASTLGSAMDR